MKQLRALLRDSRPQTYK